MIPAITGSKILSSLGNENSLVPLAAKDIINSFGLTAGSYVTGNSLEGKDRFIDEFGTQALWLFGIPAYKKVIDVTLYKALNKDPKFDVRNLAKNREKILKKSYEYADSSIKGSMKNIMQSAGTSKQLALGKFAISTALTIFTYSKLTQYKHKHTEHNAKKEIMKEMQIIKEQQEVAFAQKNKNKEKKATNKPSFGGALEEFMFSPVKNLMILDASITGKRLADSRNKQELLGYSIKEGSFWVFMYFASKPIKKFFENRVEKNKKNPASIDLDARVIESKELADAFKNNSLKPSVQKVLKLETNEQMLDYIHNNPDDFVVKMAKKSDVLPALKNASQADNVDYRAFIDFNEFKGVAKKLDKLSGKFEEYKTTNVVDKGVDAFLNNVKKLKRNATLKNFGICVAFLGLFAPAFMVAVRKMDKENSGFQVKEDLKKKMAFGNGLAE